MKKLLLTLFSLFAVTANAYALDIQDGKQYISVNGQRSVQPEVVEFFSFYCPHGYDFEKRYDILN